MMQTVPAFFNVMRLDTDMLVKSYKSAATINWILETTGLVGGSSAAAAGAAEVVKRNSIRDGARRMGDRLAGKGAISDALVDRYGAKLDAKRATGLALFAGAAAKLVHVSGKQRMTEIQAIMRHRFQGGKANNAQFAAVFGGAVDPGAIRRYWEYR